MYSAREQECDDKLGSTDRRLNDTTEILRNDRPKILRNDWPCHQLQTLTGYRVVSPGSFSVFRVIFAVERATQHENVAQSLKEMVN